jgi:hypothetical protein
MILSLLFSGIAGVGFAIMYSGRELEGSDTSYYVTEIVITIQIAVKSNSCFDAAKIKWQISCFSESPYRVGYTCSS